MTRLCIALGCITLVLAAGAQAAPTYPDQPIRLIIPYAAGGADNYVRPLQQSLQQSLGQPLVVENVGGGGGAVGAARVARANPDGYTLLFAGSGAITVAPKLAGAPYTVDDFAAVSNIISIPFMWVVKADSPITSFADLLTRARRSPGTLTYASPGHGTSTQMAADAAAKAAGVALTEVPFQGGAPAMTAVLGGHVDAMIGAPSIVMPQVAAGTLRALAHTGEGEFAPAPGVPSQQSQGADVVVVANYGVFAPKGTPDDVVARLASAIQTAADPAYTELMRGTYNDVRILGPAEHLRSVKDEDLFFTGMLNSLGLTKTK